MLAFIAAVFFLLITPGPGVLSTAGVGAAFGKNAGLRYLIGLFIGTNLVALAVVSGLAAILFSLPWLRVALLVLSAIYLLSLAIRIAMSGSEIKFIKSAKQPGIHNGILLQTINPKAYAVNTTLFSGWSFYAENREHSKLLHSQHSDPVTILTTTLSLEKNLNACFCCCCVFSVDHTRTRCVVNCRCRSGVR